METGIGLCDCVSMIPFSTPSLSPTELFSVRIRNLDVHKCKIAAQYSRLLTINLFQCTIKSDALPFGLCPPFAFIGSRVAVPGTDKQRRKKGSV